MKVTGDEKGVRALKQMYMANQKETMGYLNHAKARGIAYFRSVTPDKRYVIYEIKCSDGKTYIISKFQEGSLVYEEAPGAI